MIVVVTKQNSKFKFHATYEFKKKYKKKLFINSSVNQWIWRESENKQKAFSFGQTNETEDGVYTVLRIESISDLQYFLHLMFEGGYSE